VCPPTELRRLDVNGRWPRWRQWRHLHRQVGGWGRRLWWTRRHHAVVAYPWWRCSICIGGSSTWAGGRGGRDDAIPSWPAHSGCIGGGGRVSGGGRGIHDRLSNRGGARGRGRGGVVDVDGAKPCSSSPQAYG
jgi:hypothetical protein